MNSKINQDDLGRKINQCMDELSSLLDSIYQFPHRQRELYYERIQSLKQSLTVIKSSLKETNAVSHERKYQQIFLKITELKAEILSVDNGARKRRSSIPLGNPNRNQENYENIM